MEVVGSTTDESWEWSWGNVTLPEPCRQCMKQVYDFGVVMSGAGMLDKVKALAPDGVDHIVEVAFGANVETDVELLMAGGSIATYATNDPKAPLPFWEMVFKNERLYCLGSDDFPAEVKQQAAVDINAALAAGWKGFAIAEEVPLAEIARAQELVEKPEKPGRIVVVV